MRIRTAAVMRGGALALAALVPGAAALFCVNGLWPSWETPEVGQMQFPARSGAARRVTVMAYNIAKCFSHQGLSFRPRAEVGRCLDAIAAVIRTHKPDLVFLSEINFQCSPRPINQVLGLARRARMHAWAYADNYSWGLPFFRIRSGNALLSRFPLRGLPTQQLAGGAPFYFPVNNRRLLWAEVQVNGQWLTVGALRNDSFDLDNNLVQSKQILQHLGSRPALLGGDFNAPEGSASMKLYESSGRFSGAFAGDNSFPADKPTDRIDYILAPKNWRLVKDRVIQSQASDHLPVLATFELPQG